MVNGRQFPSPVQFPYPRLNDSIILAVDAYDAVPVFEKLDRLIHAAVIHFHVVVDHVHFKGSHAPIDHGLHFVHAGFVPFRNSHMKAIMAAAAPSLFMPLFQRLPHGHAPVLRSKVQHGGSTPRHGSPGARGKVICRYGGGQFQIKMGMGIDKAGEHITPLRLQHGICRCFHVRGNAPDAAFLRQNISFHNAAGQHQHAFSDQSGHGQPPCLDKTVYTAV